VSRPGYRPRRIAGEGRGRVRLPHKQKDEDCLSNSCSGSECLLREPRMQPTAADIVRCLRSDAPRRLIREWDQRFEGISFSRYR
jgi:hypothetical protein